MLTRKSFLIRAVSAALALLAAAGTLYAQALPPGLPGFPGASQASAERSTEATPEPASTAADDARALIGILQDEAARTRLIGELEAIAAGETGVAATGQGSPSEEPAPDAPPPLGDRITGAVPALITDAALSVRKMGDELRTTVSRLRGYRLLDTGELRRLLSGIVPVAAAVAAIYFLARRLAISLIRRLGVLAQPEGFVRTALLAVAAIAIDAIVVLLGFASGAAMLTAFPAEDEAVTLLRIVFLLTFAVAGGLAVAVRAVFSPDTPHLRALPLDDAGARYLSLRLSVVAVVLAFSELLLRELITETVSPITARATMVLIYLALGAYLIVLVLVNRRAPAAYLERQAAANDDDLTYAILAWILRYWHLVAIAFMVALMYQLVIAGEGALPLAYAATQIAAGFAIGGFLITGLGRTGDRGLRLPDRISHALPAMEERINAFLPAFTRLLRLIVLVLWLAFTLHIAGFVDFENWLEREAGVDVLGASVGVIVIVLMGFLAWLMLSSWVDYRLTPRRGHTPTARERTLLSLLRNAAAVFILLIGLMFTLSSLGISIAPLLASAGVLGLAIGFGAQKMVEDIIGGAFIQFENAVNVGDVVSAAGITGVVESLTVRSVGLRDFQGVYHVIPFSAVSTVSNFTKGFGYHVADIGIAYRENIDQAKAEMFAAFDILKSDSELGPRLIGGLEWFGVEALGDSAVTLRARLKTWPGEQWSVGRAFNEQVKKRFDAAGIEIPYRHMTLWFGEPKDGSAPPANLAVSRTQPARVSTGQPQAPMPPMAGSTTRRAGEPTDAPGDALDSGGESDR